MPNGRTYKEIQASIETHIIYINNHLGNIDQHLDMLNNRTNGNEQRITKNEGRIESNKNILFGIGIPTGLVLIGAGITFVLKMCGIM